MTNDPNSPGYDPASEEFAYLLSPIALAVTATKGSPAPYLYAPHLHVISEELKRLYEREPGWPKRLLLTTPPRHGKSELTSHWFPAWTIAVEPTTKIILCTYEAEFAARFGRMVRRTVMEHYPLLGARIVEDSRAAHRWETTDRGGMTTAGVGGPITGKGGNVLILDDPIKNAEEANSQLIRDNLWEWWQTTFLTRADKDRLNRDAVIVVILTRWHEDDLAGRLLNSPEAKLWRHVNFPAFAEEDDALGRQPGEPLWPERFDAVTLESRRAEMGSRAFAALYQQRPAPAEGGAIQRLWWKWYDELGEDGTPKLDEMDEVVQSWDPTFSDTATADPVGMFVIGRRGHDFYILDGIEKRMNGPDTLKEITATDERWPQARRLIMEDTASGTMILDILERERGHVQRIKPRGSKETRLHWGVNSVAAIVERGRVFLPRRAMIAKRLVDQAAAFPQAPHDDLVDALVQGITALMPRAWASENIAARAARGAPPPTDLVDAHWAGLRAAVKKKLKALEDKPRGRGAREGFPGV
jgi:predicted phage terminase large subunit-like protein